MGYTKWSSGTYDSLRNSYVGKHRDEIFAAAMSSDMSPLNVKFRESRDSADNPESLAIQVYLDVTGSMGMIPEILVTQKLGSLMNTLIDHGIAHPQILFGAIGDHISDHSPLQVGQFESGTNELDQWLTKIFIEGGGGGQCQESYLLAWLFAGRHTSIDCFEKRLQKGFVFTIGDEACWDKLSSSDIERLTGEKQAGNTTSAQLLSEAQRTNHVFHIHVNEGSYRNNSTVFHSWKKLLGERFIVLDDYTVLAETIAAIVAVNNGIELDVVTKNFDRKTSSVVTKALGNTNNGIVKKIQNIFSL